MIYLLWKIQLKKENKSLQTIANDLFAVENTIEERKFNSFSDMIKYIDKAFSILNDRLDTIPARFEAGQKYIFFLSRLKTLCSDIIDSMEIEVY